MERMIPIRKRHIIPLCVIGIILSFINLPYIYYPYSCTGCELCTSNSNAKLVYTGCAAYLSQCEAAGNTDITGIYCGSLIYDGKTEEFYKSYYENALFDGSEEDLINILRHLIGFDDKHAGYFYAMIKDGVPVQTYWCESEKLLYYKDILTEELEAGTADSSLYMDGAIAGGYPIHTSDYTTRPDDHVSPLKLRFFLYDAADKLLQTVMIFSPLLIMLAVSFCIYCHYTPEEYEANTRAIFEAAEIYVSHCKVSLPDMIYTGILKTRKSSPEVSFDGSPEDISAFMSGIAPDRSRNFYSIRIENGSVSECRFSIKRPPRITD